ncbi:hypothetical protein FACS1894111_09040 [Clostridia bacterium]|nr:hypothetical protein FACS1894111_09040 [Clostridia bacterium]
MFRQALKMQFSLMIQKKSFQAVFGIVLFYVIATYLFYCFRYWGGEPSNFLSADAVFAGNNTTVFAFYLDLLFPFLIVLPFAFSFLTDKSVHILPVLQSKMSNKMYYLSKAIVCFMGGFLLFVIPFLISIFLNHITFPIQGTTVWGDLYSWNFANDITGNNVMISVVGKGLPFLGLYLYSPLLYNVLYVFFFAFFSGILSVFAFATSFFIKKYKIFVFVPIYLIIFGLNILTFMLDTDGATKFYNFFAFQYITVNTEYGKTPVFIVTLTLAFVIASVFIILHKASADQLD